MSNVRKRGNSWTAQVRIAGWRSFTKTFKKKTDAIAWSTHLENKLRNAPVPAFVADAIGGWSLSGVGQQYGAGYTLAFKYGYLKKMEKL